MTCSHPNTPLFHVCPQCGDIHEPSLETDYFHFFGLKPSFFINAEQMQKEFYSLSRVLHPDRFHDQAHNLEEATRSFALVNKALSILKSPLERAKYLFSLGHFTPQNTKSALPPELAEAYFELQEMLEDGSAAADAPAGTQPLKDFAQEIKAAIERADARRDLIFEEWEKNGSPLDGRAATFFEKAAFEINQRSYLQSMAQDLERRLEKKCQS